MKGHHHTSISWVDWTWTNGNMSWMKIRRSVIDGYEVNGVVLHDALGPIGSYERNELTVEWNTRITLYILEISFNTGT